MRFGEIAVAEAGGAILAHSLRLPGPEGGRGPTFKKGRRLTAGDAAALAAAGYATVTAARLDADDIWEDEAAARLADAARGPGLDAALPFTGRANLFAAAPGLAVIERDRLDRLNLLDEAVTVATLPRYAVVAPRQMVATIKIIPFAVPRDLIEQAAAIAAEGGPLIRVAPFRARMVGLVQTRLPGLKETILEKTAATLGARLESLGSRLGREVRCDHEMGRIAAAITAFVEEGCELVLIAGASAITDRRDVVPAAIEAAGGTIDHFGMPVDPGNLLLLPIAGPCRWWACRDASVRPSSTASTGCCNVSRPTCRFRGAISC